MTKLWQYTEAQAEAMSATDAAKVLAEQEKLETDGQNETSDRELAGYALDYDDDGKPKKDSSGNYVPLKRGYDVPDAPNIWRHLSKMYSNEKMMSITVEEAKSLQPEVKKILQSKAAGGRRRMSRKTRKGKSRRRHTRKH